MTSLSPVVDAKCSFLFGPGFVYFDSTCHLTEHYGSTTVAPFREKRALGGFSHPHVQFVVAVNAITIVYIIGFIVLY